MKTETIIRTVVLAVALINQILAICGKETIPLYESDIAQIVTLVVTIGSTLMEFELSAKQEIMRFRINEIYKKEIDKMFIEED